MTTITIKIPDEGAIRLLEESIKAGVSPDRFVAMLIEERLKQSAAAPAKSAKSAKTADATPPAMPNVPQLSADGMKALERMFKKFPGAADMQNPAARPSKKRRKK